MHLYIVRGLPGSGKSTFVRNYLDNWDLKHVEADQFFEAEPGKYLFNPKLLPAAHEWCYSTVVFHLMRGWDVAVSNTFTQRWEMEKYFKLRDLFPDLTISVIEMTTQYESVHGVPKETMEKMKARWQSLPDEHWESGRHVESVAQVFVPKVEINETSDDPS